MTEEGDAAGRDTAVLEGLIVGLEENAAALRDRELPAERAAELVERSAQLAAQASAELERLARAAASEQDPSPQGRLV